MAALLITQFEIPWLNLLICCLQSISCFITSDSNKQLHICYCIQYNCEAFVHSHIFFLLCQNFWKVFLPDQPFSKLCKNNQGLFNRTLLRFRKWRPAHKFAKLTHLGNQKHWQLNNFALITLHVH